MLWAFVSGMSVCLIVVQRPDIRDRLSDGRVALAGALLVAAGWLAGGNASS